MNRARSLAARAAALALAAALTGCQTPVPAVRKPSAALDPCAERLHDVCDHLFLYYALHKALPPALADLEGLGPRPLPPLACPVSGDPYVYNPDGLRVPGRPGRLVIHDAAPSHNGMRWGVFADTGDGSGPVTARVILLAETAFPPASP